ncbi:DUF1642 domain-containing protein [Lactococcus lactis]|uniref:DUF1642 domain-containing protein n=1 Tax=Lactococcus lactis TaxID=1358 RepID=UPI00117BD25C|nr:DUF1642 domain-containing protein [Lactococcus lactis]
MTKFEEEFKALSSWDWVNVDLIQQILTRFGNWHSDEEFQAKEKEIKRLRKINHLYKKAKGNAERLAVDRGERLNQAQDELASLESQLQQQALPVVPECVAGAIAWDEQMDNSIAKILKDIFTASDKGLKEAGLWVKNNPEKYIIARNIGYTVEKPQLFYLKSKSLLENEGESEEPDVDELYLNAKGNLVIYKGDAKKFTQSEIDSMQTGSYEQIKVEK